MMYMNNVFNTYFIIRNSIVTVLEFSFTTLTLRVVNRMESKYGDWRESLLYRSKINCIVPSEARPNGLAQPGL